MTERRADDATRDAVDWLKCEYIMDKVGEEFDGIVTTATSFGLFVELAEIYVEGLVHVTSLQSDYYHFDPASHSLRGDRTGQSYQLGDSVRVRVVRVNLDDRKIDFEMAGAESNQQNPAKGSKKPHKKSAKEGHGKPSSEHKSEAKKKRPKKGGPRKKAGKKKTEGSPAGKNQT